MQSPPAQLARPAEADPLSQLRDLHLPGPIDTWPPAPGWWLLGIVLIVALGYVTYRLFQFWKKNQYRREGIAALKALKASYLQVPDSAEYLEQYNQLLKRIALGPASLTASPLAILQREKVASLTGEAWVAFLDKSGATKEFSMGCGQILIDGNYVKANSSQPMFKLDELIDELNDLGRLWIKRHKLEEART